MKIAADLMQRYPDRFLYGADGAADRSKYLKIFYQYEPLWKSLVAERPRKSGCGTTNFFDEARRKVRSWQSARVSGGVALP
jgi:hypothetical protein